VIDPNAVALIVIAKAPVAGRSKTRLTPPCTPEEAAQLARAALVDTLEVVAAAPTVRRVLALEGAPGEWLPAGFEVIRQRGEGLDERLAAAFADVGGPALLVGMDTPQMTPALLAAAMRSLCAPRTDAVLGLADDGGYWAVGLHVPCAEAFLGIPMSTDHTGAEQQRRFSELGLRTASLPPLTDVDDIGSARRVAELAPDSHFARALRAVTERVPV
jgi:rSAM/selenodomain-associated transferase 1